MSQNLDLLNTNDIHVLTNNIPFSEFQIFY